MRCLGRTKTYKRCRNKCNLLFCNHHRWQPLIIGLPLIGLIAGIWQDAVIPMHEVFQREEQNKIIEKDSTINDAIKILEDFYNISFSNTDINSVFWLNIDNTEELEDIVINYRHPQKEIEYCDIFSLRSSRPELTFHIDQNHRFSFGVSPLQFGKLKFLSMWFSEGSGSYFSVTLFSQNHYGHYEVSWQSESHPFAYGELFNGKLLMNVGNEKYELVYKLDNFTFEPIQRNLSSDPLFLYGENRGINKLIVNTDLNPASIKLGNKRIDIHQTSGITEEYEFNFDHFSSDMINIYVGDLIVITPELGSSFEIFKCELPGDGIIEFRDGQNWTILALKPGVTHILLENPYYQLYRINIGVLEYE